MAQPVSALKLPAYLCLLIFFASCTHPGREGLLELEDGNIEAAAQRFEEQVRRDPDDGDAQKWLVKARRKLLAQRLDELAQARLAGRRNEPLRAFSSLSADVARWKLELPAEFEQRLATEAEAQAGLLETKIEDELKAGYPLRARRVFQDHEEPIRARQAARVENLEKRLNEAGRERCRAFQSEQVLNRPALARLVSRFCKAFGESASALEEVVAQEEASFYRAIQCEVEVDRLPRAQVLLIGETMHKRLERTPWFDPDGMRVLQTLIAGRYIGRRTRDPVELSHRYTQDGGSKVFRHSGWRHRQHLSLTLLGKLTLQGTPLRLAHARKSEADAVEHHDRIPAIGLEPSRPEIQDEGKWLDAQIRTLGDELESKANALWLEKNCRRPARPESFSEGGNVAARCAWRLPEKLAPPEWVEAWYQRHLGLGSREARSELGIE